MMYKHFLKIVVALILVLYTGPLYAQNKDYYCCGDFYDNFRQIKYWAKSGIFLYDYDIGSGDSDYLKLTFKVPYKNNKKYLIDEINKDIASHFDKEFERLIKGNLPFHDTAKGATERYFEFRNKHGYKDFIYNERAFKAQEEARRNSLYGSNPGAVFCIIRISRRDFPVLYEIKSSVVANKDLDNILGIEEKKIGYSSPELILGEIKNSITNQLEKISETLKLINSCDQK